MSDGEQIGLNRFLSDRWHWFECNCKRVFNEMECPQKRVRVTLGKKVLRDEIVMKEPRCPDCGKVGGHVSWLADRDGNR